MGDPHPEGEGFCRPECPEGPGPEEIPQPDVVKSGFEEFLQPDVLSLLSTIASYRPFKSDNSSS